MISSPGTVDSLRAVSLDRVLVDAVRRDKTGQLGLAKSLWEMKHQKRFKRLGFPTFRAYIRSRGVGYSKAWLHVSAYQRIVIDCGIPESRLVALKFSKLRYAFKILTKDNAEKILAWCEAMPRYDFEVMIKTLRGDAPEEIDGTYRLVKVGDPDISPSVRVRTIRGTIRKKPNGNLYLVTNNPT